MSDLVLDASVATKMFLEVPGHKQALAIADTSKFLAPRLILTETSNALWKYVRRGDVSVVDAQDAVRQLNNWVTIIDDFNVVSQALKLACDLDHPVYNCTYLAIARMKALPLLTADKRLIKLAKDQNLDVVDLAQISIVN